MNQKQCEPLDTLAEEYGVFEVTMKKVACEHEEGDMLHAMAAEVAEELDRAHKEQERLQDELEFTCEDIVTASKEFTSSWALQNAARENENATSAKLNGAFREVSNRRATHEAVRAEVKRASQRTSECKRKPLRHTRVWSLTGSAPGESQMSTPEQKLRRTRAWETWVAASKRQPQDTGPREQ